MDVVSHSDCADTMAKKRIVIGCRTDPRDPERQTRHRKWVWVQGIHSTPEHPYIEQQCIRCKEYRADIYE